MKSLLDIVLRVGPKFQENNNKFKELYNIFKLTGPTPGKPPDPKRKILSILKLKTNELFSLKHRE